ncbi:MAG: ATPase, partial [Clostridiales bacterium]|nr:ATPase [Clostridiales bacterium]
MKARSVAILSGKGGTGKTFVSVNLASVSAPSTYIDCDAEEP